MELLIASVLFAGLFYMGYLIGMQKGRDRGLVEGATAGIQWSNHLEELKNEYNG